MDNRLDRDKRQRAKAYARAKEAADARKAATNEWLKAVKPKLSRIASALRLKMTKHPGRFLFRDADGDVFAIYWTGKASVRWYVPEDAATAAEVASVLEQHPRK